MYSSSNYRATNCPDCIFRDNLAEERFLWKDAPEGLMMTAGALTLSQSACLSALRMAAA